MRRWPVALVVLAGLALAAPAGADAAVRGKTVRIPAPADGDIGFAQYRVTTRSPGRAVIRNSRRLGDLKVVVSGRRIARRRYEVTAFLINPAGRATAAQADAPFGVALGILTGTDVPVEVREAGASRSYLKILDAIKSRSVNRFCRRTSRRRSGRFFRSRRRAGGQRAATGLSNAARDFTCQERPVSEIQSAGQTLASAGVDVPDCSGTVSPVAGDDKAARANLACSEPTILIAMRAQTGNHGVTCQSPPGSFCACGPACSPLPPESACFNDPSGFELGTSLLFQAVWQVRVALDRVRAESVPQGAQSVSDRKPVYTRVRG
ncbi:MAG TPA: hypothetical protein VHG69_00905 [Thermoleophilaceae bacterium]|nr:hypothetical protein [Thermoleophilaceae bacterium]